MEELGFSLLMDWAFQLSAKELEHNKAPSPAPKPGMRDSPQLWRTLVPSLLSGGEREKKVLDVEDFWSEVQLEQPWTFHPLTGQHDHGMKTEIWDFSHKQADFPDGKIDFGLAKNSTPSRE